MTADNMPSLSLENLIELAQKWADTDPDPATVNELRVLMADSNEAGLRQCFELPIVFGTAGLRGIVGPGPGHMNLAVVRRVTRGLCDYLAENQLAERPVVVGYDARLDSARFANEAIAVLRAGGYAVIGFSGAVPTPLVAFAALAQGVSSGIMVTASHTPPEYNGYKVYGATAIQIVSPVDTRIAEHMNRLPPARDIPVQYQMDARKERMLGAECVAAYVDAVLDQRPKHVDQTLRIAYTPLHGVGWNTLQVLFHAAGYADVQPVPSQVEPDGLFPTVRFPNPEEPGTLDLGMQFAETIGAHVLIANDPDADRLALALPDAKGRWHALSGNQIGVILTDYLLDRAPATNSGRQPYVVTTLVSSPMVDAVTDSRRAHLERTMTGFKWLWTTALELSKDESRAFAIAWEEALGYSTHTAVRDKDGIAAGLIAADWVAQCLASGLLPWERLGQLYRQHGAWASRQVNVNCLGADGASAMRRALDVLGAVPPSTIDGTKVARFEDYRQGAEQRPYWRGQADLFAIHLSDASRVLLRPSGTEPKLKLYIDVPAEVRPADDPFEVLEQSGQRAEQLARSLIGSLRLA